MRPGRCSRPDDPGPTAPHAVHSDAAERATDRVDARVESQDGSEECTLFPGDVPAHELVTTWMTAADDAFVDLADYR